MRPKNFVPQMESGGRECIVDMLGYVPSDERIKKLLAAGVRLAAYNEQLFDGIDGDPDFEHPPWRGRDFDVADAAQWLRGAVKRRDELLLAAKRRARKAEQDALSVAAQAKPEEQVQVSPAAGKQGREAPAGGQQASSEGSGGV